MTAATPQLADASTGARLPLVLGPAPCDHCARAPRCAALQLACSAFAAFADGQSQARWAQGGGHEI